MSLAAGEAPTEAHEPTDARQLGHRALPVAPSADPVAVFAAAGNATRFCWIQPDRDLTLVGIGAATLWRPETCAHRFAEAARFASDLAPLLRRHPRRPGAGSGETPAGPILCGGFAFDAERDDHPARWADFGAGALVVPELLGITRRGTTRWLATADRRRLDEAVDRSVALLRVAAAVPAAPPEPVLLGQRRSTEDDAYLAMIAAALAQIGAGTLSKVVPARQITARLAGSPGSGTIGVLLQRLAARYPTATTFAVGYGSHTLLGATPELLIRTRGGAAETDALAGSCARGETASDDAALGRAMLGSAKERREHDAVVEHLQSRLSAAGVALEAVPARPTIRTLPGIQHLSTPLRGRVGTAPGTILELVGALHPTPAVAGLPTGRALEFLRTHESTGRGWFSGPVGWTDLASNGEFCLALRSGLVDSSNGEVSLFAGSGVVAGSEPAAELAETDTKLDAVPAVTDSGPPAARPQ